MTDTKAPSVLEMYHITKRFPGVVANDMVNFDLQAGEIHTLLGENGAGKSTLMKILYGLQQPDEGAILLHGKEIELPTPSAAIRHGIGMIHQHFMLVPSLTVTENVALGLRSPNHPLTDLKTVAKRVSELSETYGLHVDPNAKIWQLAVGERQRVEIIKTLYREAEVLILDEPTAVLTPKEVDDLFVTFKQMAADGRSLIFISHKLNEVMELSDRITVLRDGKVTGDTSPSQTSREELAEMMVGRAVHFGPRGASHKTGKTLLKIENLSTRGDMGTDAVSRLSLEVRSGEIVGIAGVSGNGQREFAEAVSGLRKMRKGRVTIDTTKLSSAKPDSARKAGLAYVPEERMRDGAIGDFTVAENLILLDHAKEKFCNLAGFLRFSSIRKHSRKLVEQYMVKTPDLETPVKNLSGGNIQKLILARELSGNPKVLIAAQPTRGVDIGAAEYIHKRLIEQRDSGTATIVISEDLDEILTLSDRIAVMFEGKIMGIVSRDQATREKLGLMMAGIEQT